jgi:hypothetical protein
MNLGIFFVFDFLATTFGCTNVRRSSIEDLSALIPNPLSLLMIDRIL